MADEIVVWDGKGDPSATWTPGRRHPVACHCFFCNGILSERFSYSIRQRAWNKRMRAFFPRTRVFYKEMARRG